MGTSHIQSRAPTRRSRRQKDLTREDTDNKARRVQATALGPERSTKCPTWHMGDPTRQAARTKLEPVQTISGELTCPVILTTLTGHHLAAGLSDGLP